MQRAPVSLIDRLRHSPPNVLLQREAAAEITRLREALHRLERDAQIDARDAYDEGRSNEAAAARGEPFGTY